MRKNQKSKRKIYTVMSVGWHSTSFENERTWGWFSTRARAHKAISKGGVYFELCGPFNGAIIEEVEEGITFSRKRWFYKLKPNLKKSDRIRFIPMKEPKHMRQICALTMG